MALKKRARFLWKLRMPFSPSFGRAKQNNIWKHKVRLKEMDGNTSDASLICIGCGFSSSASDDFLSHCETEHNSNGDRTNKMKCQHCCFETTSIALFQQHLEKKVHKACMFHAAYKKLSFGNEGFAYEATADKFGVKSADKVVSLEWANEAKTRNS
ncbi:hypothetical protein D1R32_gp218 [Tunisvirus fontaine2]|uniref:Zinc finger protein n=1 Tax=Tunisvirus fontaine2 TaxID=1421067 RepID=V9SDX2_9VIRU|nr:hypothetical protein D1R32_gp218 [Tunisvirus fontaine2]AHC54935.1 hypothetical protein TNS_ORF217 [Tunisvirus fontaine2]